MAELADQLAKDSQWSVNRLRQLREQIDAGFQAVSAQADAVIFEFGPSRRTKMKRREDIRRWQPSLRTMLQVQLTSLQYRPQKLVNHLPALLIEAHIAFQKDIASVMRAVADEVTGKEVPQQAPEIEISFASLQQQIRIYYEEQERPLSALGADIITLTHTLAYILGPLHEDIRAACTGPRARNLLH
jgi:multidrug resistance protein MdtO